MNVNMSPVHVRPCL